MHKSATRNETLGPLKQRTHIPILTFVCGTNGLSRPQSSSGPVRACVRACVRAKHTNSSGSILFPTIRTRISVSFLIIVCVHVHMRTKQDHHHHFLMSTTGSKHTVTHIRFSEAFSFRSLEKMDCVCTYIIIFIRCFVAWISILVAEFQFFRYHLFSCAITRMRTHTHTHTHTHEMGTAVMSVA